MPFSIVISADSRICFDAVNGDRENCCFIIYALFDRELRPGQSGDVDRCHGMNGSSRKTYQASRKMHHRYGKEERYQGIHQRRVIRGTRSFFYWTDMHKSYKTQVQVLCTLTLMPK